MKQHFGMALAPATNTIARDAATILNMRQQPAEDVSKYAVGWRGSLLLFPPADRKEADNRAEQNKRLFVAGLKAALREPLTQQ